MKHKICTLNKPDAKGNIFDAESFKENIGKEVFVFESFDYSKWPIGIAKIDIKNNEVVAEIKTVNEIYDQCKSVGIAGTIEKQESNVIKKFKLLSVSLIS